MAKQMAAAYKASQKSPLTVTVFTSHFSPDTEKNFATTTGAGDQFTYLYDGPADTVVNEYRGTPCPTVLVLDKNQKIIYRSKRYGPPTNAPNMVSLARLLGLKYTPPKNAPRHPMVLVDPNDVGEPPVARPIPRVTGKV